MTQAAVESSRETLPANAKWFIKVIYGQLNWARILIISQHDTKSLVNFIAMLLITWLSYGDRCTARQWNSEDKRAKNEKEEQHFKLSRAQVERPQRQVFKTRGKVGERGAFVDDVKKFSKVIKRLENFFETFFEIL